MSSQLLPHAGLAYGHYPERRASAPHALVEAWRDALSRWQRAGPARLPAPVAAAMAAAQGRLAEASDDLLCQQRSDVSQALRRDGFGGAAAAQALALAGATMQRHLGLTPYPTQHLAAWLMLQGGFAEMATGEGKTLAMALAAAVAGLAGVPVHVLTANDYLVQRDAAALACFYAALGLSSGAVGPALPRAERAAVYRRAVVYTTAKELGFDYLRDHHRLGGARDPRLLRALAMGGEGPAAPVLPGLCLALLDEADSLLLDEACVPLILATAGAGHDVAALQRAFALAAEMTAGLHYELLPSQRDAVLSAAGSAQLAARLDGARGLLWPLRRAQAYVQAALVAQRLLQRDREYVVTPRGLALVDELTGRVAEGRQWGGALHAMVEIKEGLAPSAPTVTAAQMTYQRLFPRYLHLAGMSGTLHESRHELARLYRGRTARVPLARPARRQWLGRRLVIDEAAKWATVIAAVRHHGAQGRPVLVGTDSVAASQRLSAQLAAAGVVHQVLNALQDADEAAQIARAGQAGCVTVTTNIAGRGTDIALDAVARAAGGLHVIVAQANRARRIDRQLVGRAARHGDPGSAEAVLALDDPLLVRTWPRWLRGAIAAAAAVMPGGIVPGPLTALLVHVAQRAAEAQDGRLRRGLRQADRLAEDNFAYAGTRE